MRTRLHLAAIMLAGIQASLAVSTAAAQPIVYCAVPPVPPVGCATEKARCICDTNSRCQWYYDCTQNQSAAGGSAYAYMYPYMTRMERGGNATPLPAPGSRY
jgi:hypothetical protein